MISRSKFITFISVCCLSLSTLAYADAPVVDGTLDPNGNNASDSSNISSDNSNNSVDASGSNNSANDANSNSANYSDNNASSHNNATSDPNNNSGNNIATNEVADTSSESINQRVAQLEHQVANMNQLNLMQQVDQLQQQVQDLTGKLDVATHTIQLLQQEQKSEYSDLDQRLGQSQNNANNKPLKATPVAADAGNDALTSDNNSAAASSTGNNSNLNNSSADNTTAGNSISTDNADQNAASNAQSASDDSSVSSASAGDISTANNNSNAQSAYQSAYDDIKNKNYNNATKNMSLYLQQYPNDHNAVNAHYWLGELYLLQGQPTQAATEFNTVITQFPKNLKTADSMLKLGFAYADMHKWQQARSQLQLVQQQFSGTSTASLASERLQELKLQGH